MINISQSIGVLGNINIIDKTTSYQFGDRLSQINQCGQYSLDGSFLAFFGYEKFIIKSARVAKKRISLKNIYIDKQKNIIYVNGIPDYLCKSDLILILSINWEFIMASTQYLLKQAQSALISLGVPANELADGTVGTFTLPADTINYNVFATATIKGVTFDSVSAADFAEAQPNDKVFTFADVSGVPTLTFKYNPCDIVSAGQPGSAEAYVDEVTGVLTPQFVYVNYTK